MKTTDLDRIDADLTRGDGLPIAWMTDPDHYALERKAVFDPAWTIVATAHDLVRPGQFVTAPLGQGEIIILRDREGILRGFRNICRHRGHRLVEGTGDCRTLSCPYHAWTYGLDGALRGAPDVDLSDPERRQDLSLLPVAVQAWGPAIFANANPAAAPLDQSYPELSGLADTRGIAKDPEGYINDYTPAASEAHGFRANWKLWYDNSVECYHCGPLHSASFSAAFDPDPATMRIDYVGRLISYGFKGRSDASGDGPVSQDYRSVELYPGNFIVLHDELLLIFAMRPTGPDRGEMRVWYLGRTDADAKRLDDWITLWRQTFAEDIQAIETQARMLAGGDLPRLVYVPGREDPAIFINRLTVAALRRFVDTAPPGR